MLAQFLDDHLNRISGLLDARRAAGTDQQKALRKFITTELIVATRAVFDVLVGVRPWSEVDAQLTATVQVDFDALFEALDVAEHIATGDSEDESAEDRAMVLEAVSDARKLLTTTRRQIARLDPLELGLRLELGVNRGIELALRRYGYRPENHNIVGRVIAKMAQKLALLSADERVRIWSNVLREFQSDDGLDPQYLPAEYLTTAAEVELAYKLAEYAVQVRPNVLRNMRGAGSFPMPPLSIASVLAWMNQPQPNWTPLEQIAINSIWRIARYWRKDHESLVAELAQRLAVSPDSRLLNRSEVRENELPSNQPDLLLYELRTLLSAAKALGAVDSPIADLLWRFKLGHEVMNPEDRDRYKEKKEIFVQRVICQFLTHHGAWAIGTKFGRSEIDLVAAKAADIFVVETKVVREIPSRAAVCEWLVQLQKYMSEPPIRVKGALVIINLGEDFVIDVQPNTWIRERFMLVTVNLARESPSGHRRSVHLKVDADPEQPIDVLRIDATSRSRATAPKT